VRDVRKTHESSCGESSARDDAGLSPTWWPKVHRRGAGRDGTSRAPKSARTLRVCVFWFARRAIFPSKAALQNKTRCPHEYAGIPLARKRVCSRRISLATVAKRSKDSAHVQDALASVSACTMLKMYLNFDWTGLRMLGVFGKLLWPHMPLAS
jgi:hypothetical protein